MNSESHLLTPAVVAPAGNRFLEERRIATSEDVLALACIGRTALCVAMGGKYWLLRSHAQSLEGGSNQQRFHPHQQHQQQGDQLQGWRESWMPLVPFGHVSGPCILPIPPREFLLGKVRGLLGRL